MAVLDLPGLRPTGDRVRETLFNWLGPNMPGVKALDLFAGSGALGLEALSRDAEAAVFVDRSHAAIEHIKQSTASWPGIERARWVCADAMDWLSKPSEKFDLVFIDPPFDEGLQGQALKLLVEGQWLYSGGLVYLESPKNKALTADQLPAGVERVREKTVAHVHMLLVRYHTGSHTIA